MERVRESHQRGLNYRQFHQNDLKNWYRLFLRSSSLLNLDLHDRVAFTMLDLRDDFGIEDARGTLLQVSFSHKDIASIVGASRLALLSISANWAGSLSVSAAAPVYRQSRDARSITCGSRVIRIRVGDPTGRVAIVLVAIFSCAERKAEDAFPTP